MDTQQPYEGRRAHWIRYNHTERMPHRWIVADTESYRVAELDGEAQRLRCWDAVRWRTDLQTGDHAESAHGETAADFWQWVDDYTRAGARTVLWFHNASYDLRTLDCFAQLPALGWELDWCNLDRDVSVATWRSDHGTLVIADTWTWLAKPLADVSGMVGIGKPRLPDDDDTLQAWHARCAADVQITAEAVRQLLQFVKDEHLGNWQPSGAGMGYATWRHRFLNHKVLVHDDAPAIAAERAAMHAGRAEAWWHGKAKGGPFTEWDMHMSYCRIAAECDVPVKLFADDGACSDKVHRWAMRHWTVLCEVEVTTQLPVVPHQTGERTLWPVGTFRTTLWQPELELIERTGGSYKVLHQWRYNAAPALAEWAKWSMAMCAADDSRITPVQRTWVKHQSRALIGRLALRNASWSEWGANPYGWCGLTDLVDGDTGEHHRMMHVGGRTFVEGERKEASSSLPQITGYIMAVSRVRLWDAAAAAGLDHVLHVDTDSVICDRHGTAALEVAIGDGLAGGWRPKERWSSLDVTGPRHYRSSGRRVIPGVPRGAVETSPGIFRGDVWQSLASSLEASESDVVRVMAREWKPRRFDGRRPWGVEGVAQPIRLPEAQEETHGELADRGRLDTGRGRAAAPSNRRPRGRAAAGGRSGQGRPTASRPHSGGQDEPQARSHERRGRPPKGDQPRATQAVARTPGRRGRPDRGLGDGPQLPAGGGVQSVAVRDGNRQLAASRGRPEDAAATRRRPAAATTGAKRADQLRSVQRHAGRNSAPDRPAAGARNNGRASSPGGRAVSNVTGDNQRGRAAD
jgi:hypothetical protein